MGTYLPAYITSYNSTPGSAGYGASNVMYVLYIGRYVGTGFCISFPLQ